MVMTSQNGQREQFKALLRKNYTLKRRGLWCCSLFELLVPAAFVALMCLPKALVPDEKNHDVLYRPFSIGAGWNPIGQLANTPEIDADGTGMSFSDTSFSEGWLKLCLLYSRIHNPYIAVGWVKPLAAYPAKNRSG